MRGSIPLSAVLGVSLAACAGRPCRTVEVVRVVPVPVAVAPAPAPSPGRAPPRKAQDPVARRREQIEAAKEREPFVPLLGDADAKVAVPSLRRIPEAPTLARAAAAMPRTFEAEMRAWGALQKEGTLDGMLLQEVFLVVSTTNDCGY